MYIEFVDAAQKQDKRNNFSVYNGDLEFIPREISEFYRKYNPQDVEVVYCSNSIRFFPVEKIEKVMCEYGFHNSEFIFATCNGDPIYLKDGKVFTCPHGIEKIQEEKIADGFYDFLNMVTKNINNNIV